MSRIGDFPDDDLTSWFASSPELGGAIANFSDAVYHRSRLPVRVREIARMAIALDNECAVCENTRFGEGPQAGLDEEFWTRCKEHFSDDILADLALSCALWIGMGRVLRTLDIGQACKITV